MQIKAGTQISEQAEKVITDIMDNLIAARQSPNKKEEIGRIRRVCKKGKMKQVKPTKVDLFVKNISDDIFLFDIKTAKPNRGGFHEFKTNIT